MRPTGPLSDLFFSDPFQLVMLAVEILHNRDDSSGIPETIIRENEILLTSIMDSFRQNHKLVKREKGGRR